MKYVAGRIALVAVASVVALGAAEARELSFEERVRAQEAIERVYHRHQTGALQPFEVAVPRALVEAKVRTYLRQSAALETHWDTPVTGEMLERELLRMARGSRMPERLAELFAALGHDALLVQECLVRPVLVDRLAHSFFSADSRIQGVGMAKPSLASWLDENRATLDRALEVPEPGPLPQLPVGTLGAGCEEDDTWYGSFMADQAPNPRGEHTAIWTGSVMIVWGGEVSGFGYTNTGGRYDPTLDSWSPTNTTGAPSARFRHSAVWTSSRMIVWGGISLLDSGFIQSGGRYDPATDTWSPMSAVGAPVGRVLGTFTWTGSQAVLWGGQLSFTSTDVTQSGGRYDPSLDEWSATELAAAPVPRSYHAAVWTGNDVVLWGGYGFDALALGDGARYTPSMNTWAPIASAGAPAARYGHTAVWTGTEMIVWGGVDDVDQQLSSGGRYGPALNSWLPVSTIGAPPPGAAAFWTGGSMLVAGLPGAFYALGQTVDHDGDGSSTCAGDCDDTDPAVYAGAPELNDAQDNQCPGESGYGIADEIEGSMFFGPDGLLCWSDTSGATMYEVARSPNPDFNPAVIIDTVSSANPCMADDGAPPPGGEWYYLVRATAPHVGSWGQDSSGQEIIINP